MSLDPPGALIQPTFWRGSKVSMLFWEATGGVTRGENTFMAAESDRGYMYNSSQI